MYEAFFGLTERPFDLTPSPRFLVLTDSHREALRNLEYGIASRKGITLLIGEAGAGKTTIIRSAIEKQPTKVHCVHLNNPTLSRDEFCAMLATRFGLSDRAVASKTHMLVELETLLRERRAHGETTVLIVDEAQSLSLDLLEEIRLLANIETNDEKLMSVIIAGQPELAARLNERDLRQLKQRVALRCELRPLSRLEAEAYVAGRIRAAGGVGAEVFTREAVALLHQVSRGLPRIINVLADNALLGGFAAGVRPVGSSIVMDVCRDFDLVPQGPLEGATPAPPAVPVGAGATRGEPAATSRAVPADAAATGTDSRTPSTESTEMFGTFAGRRKRFSFFWS
jgi:general secretion pathway protein A